MKLPDFDSLYSEHYPEICRFCFKRLGNQEDAEDLTDESFVKAYLYFDSNRNTSFRTYIFKIAKNLCLDHYKSKRHRQKTRTHTFNADLLIDHSLKTNGDVLQQEILNALYQCLDNLGEQEQLAIRFHFIEQFAYREIADIIGRSISTVKNRIESGLKNLQICLQKKGIIGS